MANYQLSVLIKFCNLLYEDVIVMFQNCKLLIDTTLTCEPCLTHCVVKTIAQVGFFRAFIAEGEKRLMCGALWQPLTVLVGRPRLHTVWYVADLQDSVARSWCDYGNSVAIGGFTIRASACAE